MSWVLIYCSSCAVFCPHRRLLGYYNPDPQKSWVAVQMERNHLQSKWVYGLVFPSPCSNILYAKWLTLPYPGLWTTEPWGCPTHTQSSYYHVLPVNPFTRVWLMVVATINRWWFSHWLILRFLYRCTAVGVDLSVVPLFAFSSLSSLSIASWLTLFQTSEAEHCAVMDMWWADEDTFKPGTGTYVGCLPGRHVRVDLPPFAGVFGTFLDFPRLLQFLFQCIVAGIKSEWA